ncbi:hypothetical protein AHAS_Ahas09G0133700 [Arachis hypogaea]
MDVVALKNHLQLLARGGIWTAEVERLKEIKKGLEEERDGLTSDLDKAWSKAKKAKMSLTMSEGLKKKAEESYTHVFRERLDIEKELAKAGEKYAVLEEFVAERIDEMFVNLKAQI